MILQKEKRKHTKIVVTIGPSSDRKSVISDMIENGMDMARLNFSWGTHKEHAFLIKNIRAAALSERKRIPIVQDLSGPRVQEGSGHKFGTRGEKLLTEKDKRDLAFGAEQKIEYVAMSYVGDASDIADLRAEMKR